MGYLHIQNLYKCQDVLLFKELYALEKVHGTSAHISLKEGSLAFFAGGANHERFVSLFNAEALKGALAELGAQEVVVYGEAYGGKMQGMRDSYGDNLAFIVFDVRIDTVWLPVPAAEAVATKLGLEFVPWVKIPATVESCDAERDRPSGVAERRGRGFDKRREGVVLRPVLEVLNLYGERIIAKHKRDEFRETATPRVVLVDPSKAECLAGAEAIALEWVTPMRLEHVLSKKAGTPDLSWIPAVVVSMVEDVEREAVGEIVKSRAAHKAIGARTVKLFKARLQQVVDGD